MTDLIVPFPAGSESRANRVQVDGMWKLRPGHDPSIELKRFEPQLPSFASSKINVMKKFIKRIC
jgi:hypothetical protein